MTLNPIPSEIPLLFNSVRGIECEFHIHFTYIYSRHGNLIKEESGPQDLRQCACEILRRKGKGVRKVRERQEGMRKIRRDSIGGKIQES